MSLRDVKSLLLGFENRKKLPIENKKRDEFKTGIIKQIHLRDPHYLRFLPSTTQVAPF